MILVEGVLAREAGEGNVVVVGCGSGGRGGMRGSVNLGGLFVGDYWWIGVGGSIGWMGGWRNGWNSFKISTNRRLQQASKPAFLHLPVWSASKTLALSLERSSPGVADDLRKQHPIS